MFFNIMFYIFLTVLGIAIISSVVQNRFKQNRQYYGAMANTANKTGAEVANLILQKWNINNVMVVMGKEGQDHYNPHKNQIVLSPSIYNSSSVSAAAIAAHEVGHVIQWAKQERKIKVRDALVQPVQIISQMGNTIMSISMFMLIFSFGSMAVMGNVFAWMMLASLSIYGVTGLFQLATLPVEFDASRKAKKELDELGIIPAGEQEGVKKVLNSAAMTYVIAFLSSIIMFAIMLLALLSSRR